MATNIPKAVLSTLITANHILHYNKVVDSFGHISVRNPTNPATFFLSGDLAPALVSSLEDLVEYNIEDASSVRKDARKGYIERYIHSEIYKKYPDVQSVVHAHAEVVVPFSISSQPIRPVFHMGSVIGSQVPVYDIQLHYKQSDTRHNLLVNNQHLGAGLAAAFNPSSLISKTTSLIKNYLSSTADQPLSYPPNTTVLMRGHGFTCVGTCIEEAVYRSIYLCSNARIQTSALLLQNAYNTRKLTAKGVEDVFPIQMDDIQYLSDRECKEGPSGNKEHITRPWKLWCAEVADAGLYQNALGPPPGA